jgi:hypothetical protein
MKTLKIVMLMILLSLFMTSCTDLINSDDELMIDTIENVDTTSEVNGGDGNNSSGCSGKGC